jgi:multidrug transporter EmrE-like cation transporter
MTVRAAVLVLVSAMLHAVWNALIKREKDARGAGQAVLAVATISATVLTPFARQDAFPTANSLRWAIGAGVCEGAYFVSLGLALARGPLGPVYTVARGGAMLVAWPISIVFLGEALSWPARIGVALIATGLGLTTFRPREHASPAGLGWAAISSVGIAGYHLSYKLALAAGAESRALFPSDAPCRSMPRRWVEIRRGVACSRFVGAPCTSALAGSPARLPSSYFSRRARGHGGRRGPYASEHIHPVRAGSRHLGRRAAHDTSDRGRRLRRGRGTPPDALNLRRLSFLGPQEDGRTGVRILDGPSSRFRSRTRQHGAFLSMTVPECLFGRSYAQLSQASRQCAGRPLECCFWSRGGFANGAEASTRHRNLENRLSESIPLG